MRKKKKTTLFEEQKDFLDNYCDLLDGLKRDRDEAFKPYADEKIARIKESIKVLEMVEMFRE
jgi:hypothetical protein